MANVKFNKKDFENEIKLSKEIEEKINLFGTNLESITEEEIEIEVFPNRPDLLSLQGFLRSLKAFIGKEKGLKKYKTKKPELNYQVKIDSSVKQIRPYTICAVVKNLSLNNKKIIEIIELQEKLHATLGRNRKKAAIGIYPLDKIKFPIYYTTKKPSEIKFIPLEMNEELNGLEILQRHPKGRDYANLLEGKEKFPVFIDANKKFLSMPPIINSKETGKITETTKEVFVECTGFDKNVLNKILNIIVTTLADFNGTIYEMEIISNEKEITPNLTPEKMDISIENVNSLLGLSLKEKEVQKYLEKMGYDYNNKKVFVPPWRTDILHEVDLIEDIAIAYGYNNFIPEIPKVSTIGSESKESMIERKISEVLIGLGLIEISTYHLIKDEEDEKFKLGEKIEVKNSKTEYKSLRQKLIIPSLRILSENKDNEYPQKIFEIGTVFSKDKRIQLESGIKENKNLIVSISPGNFTEIKRILDYLMYSLNIKYDLSESYFQGFIKGRVGAIKINEKIIGYIGEVHPETLRNFNIKMPVSYLEISLEEIFKKL